jgi:hypothetical protein
MFKALLKVYAAYCKWLSDYNDRWRIGVAASTEKQMNISCFIVDPKTLKPQQVFITKVYHKFLVKELPELIKANNTMVLINKKEKTGYMSAKVPLAFLYKKRNIFNLSNA